MPSITRIPKAQITGPYGYLLKRFSRKMLGEVPDGAAVMWNNRPVMTAMMTLSRKAKKWDQLDANLKAFAHMAVAAKVGCSFCLDLGYFQLTTTASTSSRPAKCRDGGSRRCSHPSSAR
jgi:hypothetical protein